jgi:hypothetical protein
MLTSMHCSRCVFATMRKLLHLNVALLGLYFAGCAAATSGKKQPPPPPPPSITVTVTPPSANIRAGDSLPFTAAVSGTTNVSVTWSVNGIAGGSATLGTITANGSYTAPASLPNPNTITIRATSTADSSASGVSNVSLLNPTPTLTSINPTSVAAGNFTLTVTGSKFVSGAQVLLGATPLQTTFSSTTQLTATGTANSAGTFAVTVSNPNPGSSSSSSANLQVTGSTQGSACGSMVPGQGSSLGGFLPFPADSLWNTDISSAPVDPKSTAIINFIGGTTGIHADFGAGQFQGSTIGIPYLIVGASQPPVTVTFNQFGSESDPGPMPIPVTAPIEGFPNPGDQHVLVLDNSNCFLYELYASAVSGNSWTAGSSAIWDLLSNEQRPYTWTSADAAGLPIFPGLVRYDEVSAGQVQHAFRFTLRNSSADFTPPASHMASTSGNASAAPMGMRMRLKSSFDVSGFSAANQVILNALKRYGMIMADNGSNMFLSGAPDDRWDNNDLHNLGMVTASDFEVIQMSPLYTQNTVPTGPAPQINSFTASANSISAGTPVTLSWQVTNASYVIVSPSVGAIRTTTVSVSPSQTTTYTLYATNAFDRTMATVTVTVH